MADPRRQDRGGHPGDVELLIKNKVEPAAAVENLYLRTLSRRPTEDETREAIQYVESSEDRKIGYAGVLWMLLNRSEFMLIR